MQDIVFGTRVRSVRIRLGLRQADVAARSGVSDMTVSRIEHGHLDAVTVAALRAVASTLEIRVDIVPRWRGGDLDRLVNARHAQLAEVCVRRLREVEGWEVRPEVSFSIFGERGVIDLLAWHAGSRAVLVIELKTQIVDVGELLGTLDRKTRLAREVATGLGWDATTIATCLLVAEGRTNRRHIEAHAGLFQSAFPDDARRLRMWLRDPRRRLRALVFVPNQHQGGPRTSLSTPRRISRPRTRPVGARDKPGMET